MTKIIKKNTDRNLRVLSDDEKFSLLADAIKKGIKKFVKLLNIQIKQNFDIDHPNEYGTTLLHIACRCRNFGIVKHLIDVGAKVDIVNQDGRTPLHIIAIYGSTDSTYYSGNKTITKSNINESIEIIRLLLSVSPHITLIPDNDGKTPMDYYKLHTDLENLNVNPFKHEYMNHKRRYMFFEMIKNSTTIEDYKLTLNIYFKTRC